ncbi:uncharacterized protein BX664DRAFT_362234 [Halteromyces radiatus]|uniref:uncharacterized protein n=1 Tax=Halteromyces radiatus TaxID=101107 RepID=UPI002220BDDB|nr:uncharacterized protein BX664DRAFT_362234 [Halteromyces radiatus]KAI8078658.1 hypothetical protein BX664DRAFT_362234 [Halteromyces radiatus]
MDNTKSDQEQPVEAAEIDHEAKAWITEQVEKEVKRIRDVGSSVLPMKILNCGVLPNFEQKKARAINRIELDSNNDVSNIEQVMVSPAIPYPHKDNFYYVNLILVTGKPIPFIVPYLYQHNIKVTQPEKEMEGRKIPSKQVILKNELKEFLFINKVGIRGRFSIHEYHDIVLQDQYEASPFHKNKKETLKPTRLDIFDFDSTLFLSPSLSPTIWHPTLIKELVGEDVFGPGWWKDYRSLDLGPIDILEATHWADYWNEDIVEEARKSLEDPTIMTVLLTGRRHVPFYPLISRMLASKGLAFDLLGLRPDPTQETHDAHVNNEQQHNVLAYGASSVFANTLHFKTSFILNLLHNVPSLDSIKMWDDRLPHVKRFQGFLNTLISKRTITTGSAIHVPAIRPRYRPKWERRIVNHVLATHSANELLYLEQQRWNRKINTISWDDRLFSDDDDDEDGDGQYQLDLHIDKGCLTKVAKHLSLTLLPSSTIVRLDDDFVQRLQTICVPFYNEYLKKHHKTMTGWQANAERPLWFGQQIVLSPKVLSAREIQQHYGGGLGMQVKCVMRSVSIPDPVFGMMALVDIYPSSTTNGKWETASPKKYLLALLYKPSDATFILRKKFNWIPGPFTEKIEGNGQVALSYLLGLDGTVKNNEEHQLVCLDAETKALVLGKRASTDDLNKAKQTKKQHRQS